jgi:hypothetical protein
MLDVLLLTMSPRPIQRWKSVWLGLLVLIFLGWAWLRSMSYHEGIRWFNWDWGVMIGQGPEGVGLYAGDRPTFLSEGLHLWNLPVHDPAAEWFGRPFLYDSWPAFQIHGNAVLASSLQLAHWFLILLFLVPWAGFLIWRIRRMRRGGEMPRSVESS